MGIQEGIEDAPLLRISVEELTLPTFTTSGWPIRKSRTQLHSEEFRPGAVIYLSISHFTIKLRTAQVASASDTTQSLEFSFEVGRCMGTWSHLILRQFPRSENI